MYIHFFYKLFEREIDEAIDSEDALKTAKGSLEKAILARTNKKLPAKKLSTVRQKSMKDVGLEDRENLSSIGKQILEFRRKLSTVTAEEIKFKEFGENSTSDYFRPDRPSYIKKESEIIKERIDNNEQLEYMLKSGWFGTSSHGNSTDTQSWDFEFRCDTYYRYWVSVSGKGKGIQLNRLHFVHGIPKILQGIGLGYKLYLAFILQYGHAMSAPNASPDANKLWAKLLTDEHRCYGVIVGGHKIAISKKVNDLELIEIVYAFLNHLQATENSKIELSDLMKDKSLISKMKSIGDKFGKVEIDWTRGTVGK